MKNKFWIPLVLGLAFAAVALAFPNAQSLGLSRKTLIIIALILIGAAGLLAWTSSNPNHKRPNGGTGGNANAREGATAVGGAGGRARLGSGGKGGSATASGQGSHAQGGQGGDG